jgi:glycosyltransferase involved in cell wall biosynthesis
MKAPMVAVDAFRRALEACPSLHLEYVGDGVLLPAVRQLVAALGITRRFTIHGALSNRQTLSMMKRCHILIHPSVSVEGDFRFDTCPVAVSEAMAAGMAIVATRHGGIPEQIIDGENGYLVDEYDSVSLSARIIALARDRELRDRLGAAAWESARAMFDRQVVRDQMLKLLGLQDESR